MDELKSPDKSGLVGDIKMVVQRETNLKNSYPFKAQQVGLLQSFTSKKTYD